MSRSCPPPIGGHCSCPILLFGILAYLLLLSLIDHGGSRLGSVMAFSTTTTTKTTATTATTTTTSQRGLFSFDEMASSIPTSSRTHDLVNNSQSLFSPTSWLRSSKPTATQKCGPCPPDEEDDEEELVLEHVLNGLFETNDDDERGPQSHNPPRESSQLDRREAAFAMLGTLWATTTTAFPQPASALYGSDAKIELPNVMENMANRASKQCLVESLGNRECLVWMDPDNQLYQGVDSQKLLQKIDASSAALAKIPDLVQAKKWSGIKGILTGPMGELLVTMNQLAAISTQQPSKSTKLAQQVKTHIFDISAATDRKDSNAILKSTNAATDSLVAFVQSL